ncbi:cation transporter [Sutterella wadsworthensis]|uniref:heavy-metal-associated domain-containing protein n=1 Tax=Sutterella wadsworthensis TaxID=40545 RepID=UPI0032C156A4
MYKTIVGIEGMACGMCEEHICSTIKKAFEVNKVKASRSKKYAEIITELPLDEKAVRDAIAPTGYEVTSFACVEEAPKKGFFAKLFG